jgi:hypothetical protein
MSYGSRATRRNLKRSHPVPSNYSRPLFLLRMTAGLFVRAEFSLVRKFFFVRAAEPDLPANPPFTARANRFALDGIAKRDEHF